MGINGRRKLTIVLAASAIIVGTSGAALAVSGGVYDPKKLDCSPAAEANDRGVEPGCHSTKVNVEDGQGRRYAQAGTLQTAVGDNVHSGDYSVDSNGDGSGTGASGNVDTNYQPFPPGDCGAFDLVEYPIDLILNLLQQGGEPCKVNPSKPAGPPTVSTPAVHQGDTNLQNLLSLKDGGEVYFAADDNLDSGEHDGSNGQHGTGTVLNGPSDGGGLALAWHPLDAASLQELAKATTAHPQLLLSHPVPLASGGFGFCADGVCISVQTDKTLVYQGGTAGERDAADYTGKTWDPDTCSSGSDEDETKCAGPNPGDPQTQDDWKAREKSVYAEPGVQLYEDPDPQGSPLGPYPLPGVYVGTCGVTAGGGDVPVAASPVTNSANQAQVKTGC